MSYFASPYSRSSNQPQTEWESPWRIEQERRHEEEQLAKVAAARPSNPRRVWPARPERRVPPAKCLDCGIAIRNNTKHGRCIKHSRLFYRREQRHREKAVA